MALPRRRFIRSSSGAAAVAVIGTRGRLGASPARAIPGAQAADEIEELYRRSIVVDSLAVGREWDEAEFRAVEETGYTAIQTTLPSPSLEVALQALAEWNDRCAAHPDRLVRATTAHHVEGAKHDGRMAVIYGFQNSTMLEGDADNLDVLYQLGTRCIQLTYNSRNLVGNGCTERVDGGLSDFGVEVVERMNELGILVDLSHCGYQTTLDGIAFSDASTPACFTHTMCEALYPDHPRAKTDEQIRAMADRGGVIGIAALGYFVGPDPGGETTVERYLDHIDHAVNLAGVDQVGLCTDFQVRGISSWATRENWYEPRLRSFKPSYNVRWPPWIPELDATDRFLTVARGLDARGYTHEQIRGILGGNWLEYFGRVIG